MIVRSDDSRAMKSESNAALKALTSLVRSDYSFSDYGSGPSFHNLSLQMAPISAEIAVSKQMLQELALRPLFQTFCLGKILHVLAAD